MALRVLVIEADRFLVRMLEKVLGDAGYDVQVAGTARDGFRMACEMLPACIVCDTKLPDVDGLWVARRVRTEAGAVSKTPFLFLISAGDSTAKLEGLSVGADAHVVKPFRNDELVAQVGALVEMAKRLRERPDSFFSEPPSSRGTPAFRGDLAQLSVTTLFGMLELERRTGRFKARADRRRVAEFDLLEGAIVGARLGGAPKPALDALRAVLGWKSGRFWFRPGPAPDPSAPRLRIGALLLEAMRLEDEAKGSH